MKSATIVIPSYNHWNLTHSLLMDIYRNFPQGVQVIVVDDCSTDTEVSSGLEWWKTQMLPGRLKVYVNVVNCGFLRTANFGVSKSDTEIVMLVNTDVKISDRTVLSKVLTALDTEFPTLVGSRLLSGDTGWNTFDGKTFPYLEGWFLAFKKSEWEQFGGFDIRYAPNDYEDVDISTTYIHNGGKLVEIEVDMQHLGGQSIGFTPEREKQTKINQKKFEEKWMQ